MYGVYTLGGMDFLRIVIAGQVLLSVSYFVGEIPLTREFRVRFGIDDN